MNVNELCVAKQHTDICSVTDAFLLARTCHKEYITDKRMIRLDSLFYQVMFSL